MNNSDFDSILKTIADQHSTTPEEVKAGICEAITAGMKNSDPAKCNLWRSMGSGAEVPEPEDAVLFLGADSHKNSWPFGSIGTFHNGAMKWYPL